MQQLIKILAAITFLMIFISCNEEILPPAPAPEFAIEGVTVPLRLNVAKPRDYNIAFRVTHPGGAGAVGEVSVTFFGSDRVTELLQLPLYDDGGFLHPGDRDVIAGDGIFTNHFISDSLVFPLGDVFMKVRAVDNAQNSIQTDLIGALALLNAAPKVLSAAVPDTLFSGSQLLLFSVAVQDSNDIEDVTGVVMRLKRSGSEIASYLLEFQSKTAPDSGIFGAFFDSTFAAERDSLYTLEFQAADLSDDVSEVLNKFLFLENKPPHLTHIELPDTILLPAVGVDTVVYRATINDPQGVGDIERVQFLLFRATGDTAALEMFDDGNFADHRDLIAGDGIYSRGLSIDVNNTPGRVYYIFQGWDKVGNFTAELKDSSEIVR